jgi:haloalkane dehalogenase
MTDAIRTPDELLLGLPDFPFEPSYRKFDDFRLAHVDVGDGPPVVFLHGEPTWSFLWRRVFPPVRDAGYRCIAPDLPGFGRSDKPIDIDWYTYDAHTASIAALFEELDLRDATVVVHDWGGPIGLRVAVERAAERIARIVALDTGLFTGRRPMNDAWMAFRSFVERTEDLPVGLLVRRACSKDPGDEVIAAYDAPFPNAESKAGARAFPLILPLSPEMPGADVAQRVLDALRSDTRPRLFLWAESDPVIPLETGRRFAAALGGSQIDHVIAGASHFLQEDAGPEIGSLIASWLASNP